MRADSGFDNHAVVAACLRAGCPLLNHHSPAAERTPADRGDSGRGLDADPVLAAGRRGCRRDDLHAVPAQGGCHPGAAHRAARQAGARLTARALRELQLPRLHHRSRRGDAGAEAGHRRHAEIENAIRDLKYGVGLNHLPSGRFGANAAWLAVQVIAHNLARWTARLGLGEGIVTTRTLRRRYFALRRDGSPTRPGAGPCTSRSAGPGLASGRALARLRALPLPV